MFMISNTCRSGYTTQGELTFTSTNFIHYMSSARDILHVGIIHCYVLMVINSWRRFCDVPVMISMDHE